MASRKRKYSKVSGHAFADDDMFFHDNYTRRKPQKPEKDEHEIDDGDQGDESESYNEQETDSGDDNMVRRTAELSYTERRQRYKDFHGEEESLEDDDTDFMSSDEGLLYQAQPRKDENDDIEIKCFILICLFCLAIMVSMLVGVVLSSTGPSSEDIDITSQFHETIKTVSFEGNGSMPEEHSDRWYGSSTTATAQNIDVDHVIDEGQRGELINNNAAEINITTDMNTGDTKHTTNSPSESK